MKPEWFVIANASLARLFSRDGHGGPLRPLPVLTHAESRQKVHELVTDRAGHEDTDRRRGGVPYEPRTDVMRKEQDRFAREVAHRIDQALQHGECGGVTVLASSPFLGDLKAHLTPATERALRGAHDLDLTQLSLNDLEQRLTALHL
jgi:protein required for attachment to host cells